MPLLPHRKGGRSMKPTHSSVFLNNIKGIINKFEQLPENVRSLVLGEVFGFCRDLEQPISLCESPIEQIFYVYLNRELEESNIRNGRKKFIFQQLTFEVCGIICRPDFVIGDIYDDYHLFIECDGHNFHEKTKEQAAKDKSRDRAFAKAGYHIIRFTGSEIYNDPLRCAREAIEVFENIVYQKKGE